MARNINLFTHLLIYFQRFSRPSICYGMGRRFGNNSCGGRVNYMYALLRLAIQACLNRYEFLNTVFGLIDFLRYLIYNN